MSRGSDAPARILAALPGTRPEIGQRTGLVKSAVFCRLRDLHAAGQVHIAGWVPAERGGPAAPVYAAGPGLDAPQPAPTGNAWRQRRLRSGERIVFARTHTGRRIRVHPLMVRLYGMRATRGGDALEVA